MPTIKKKKRRKNETTAILNTASFDYIGSVVIISSASDQEQL